MRCSRASTCSGKIAVVTGASTGLGLETARALASAGAQVVLAGRDAARIDAAVGDDPRAGTRRGAGAGSLDLTSLDSVRAFARVVRGRRTTGCTC